MIPIIILSQHARPSLLAPLTAALGGRVSIDTADELTVGGGEFVIFVRRRLPQVHQRAVVAVCSWQGGRLMRQNHLCAALSDDRRARRILRQSGCGALCCGMSLADSLTLSSLREDSAVISLQRELEDIGGNILEPCDLPVTLSSQYNTGDILLASACALLCGAAPKTL